MTKVGVLFSGGKDSSLAAILLSRDYSVELNTFVFRESRVLRGVERAAEHSGSPGGSGSFPKGSSPQQSIPSWIEGILVRR